jgi:hypothetical protein
VKKIQIKGQTLFKGDNDRNVRKGWDLILKNHEARKA